MYLPTFTFRKCKKVNADSVENHCINVSKVMVTNYKQLNLTDYIFKVTRFQEGISLFYTVPQNSLETLILF